MAVGVDALRGLGLADAREAGVRRLALFGAGAPGMAVAAAVQLREVGGRAGPYDLTDASGRQLRDAHRLSEPDLEEGPDAREDGPGEASEEGDGRDSPVELERSVVVQAAEVGGRFEELGDPGVALAHKGELRVVEAPVDV